MEIGNVGSEEPGLLDGIFGWSPAVTEGRVIDVGVGVWCCDETDLFSRRKADVEEPSGNEGRRGRCKVRRGKMRANKIDVLICPGPVVESLEHSQIVSDAFCTDMSARCITNTGVSSPFSDSTTNHHTNVGHHTLGLVR